MCKSKDVHACWHICEPFVCAPFFQGVQDGLIHRQEVLLFSFFLSFFHYASMALFVECMVVLVGSFHGWLGVDVAFEFAQGMALRG